ncbi:Leukocyte cell-derived chemotaxin-2 [Labeo rohita]|uniref:Leukocyte cell-derived chemotaxin-2 n=1 Tax=Labeo rohita TaxID=84645 RepID=A0ABQ8LJU0_LABRO|nr:Leukocyte cell-derived chemotaxin-2 [Labeo rohita]
MSVLLLAVFLVGICLENDKKTTKRKEQGEEIKIPQPDKRLTVIGKAREALNWTRGAKPRNDMGCTSIGGICQRNTYICQGRYLKDKCRGEKSRWCCTPATAWSALCAGSHHNRARACDSYGCGGFNSRRYFRNSFFPESISWITDKAKASAIQVGARVMRNTGRAEKMGIKVGFWAGPIMLGETSRGGRVRVLGRTKELIMLGGTSRGGGARVEGGEAMNLSETKERIMLDRTGGGRRASVSRIMRSLGLEELWSDGRIHKGIDIVCGDYGIINAPFTGNLGGPVGRAAGDSVQYDGVKLYNKVHCVKIFNIRPYVYFGSVVQGEAMGYLLPLQEHFSGITSHLELQMCDGSDPSPFI